MKTLSFFIVLSFVTPAGYGDKLSELKKVYTERDILLERIVEAAERDCGLGIADSSEVLNATLALHAFRRDHAADRSKRKESQLRIVEIREQELAKLEELFKASKVRSLKMLKAKDRLLAARQRLLEIEAQAVRPDAESGPRD